MRLRLALAAVIVLISPACDIGQITVGTTAKILVRAQPALQQESDYQLAHDAIPGALKTIEGFWIVSPDNEDLLGILTEGYCQYGTAFVEDDWEIAKDAGKRDEVEYHNARATRMFSRCLNYALKQLGDEWQNGLFGEVQAVAELAKKTDGDQRNALMWAALALGSIINHNLSRVETMAYQPTVKVMLERVVELDTKNKPERPDYAAYPHIAFGMLYSAVGAGAGGKPDQAKDEFQKAFEATGKRMLLAQVLMGYRVGKITNDRKFFHEQLKQVLETRPDIWPEQRLANEVAHRRARRYLSHEKELFQ